MAMCSRLRWSCLRNSYQHFFSETCPTISQGQGLNLSCLYCLILYQASVDCITLVLANLGSLAGKLLRQIIYYLEVLSSSLIKWNYRILMRITLKMHSSLYHRKLPMVNKKQKHPSTSLLISSPIIIIVTIFGQTDFFSPAFRNEAKKLEIGLCHLLRLPVLEEGMFDRIHATSEKYLRTERNQKCSGPTERNRDKSLQPKNLREQLPNF